MSTVYVSTVPAELLVTSGEPQHAAIPGTSLQYVSNTETDIFLDTTNQSYYVLTADGGFSRVPCRMARGVTFPLPACRRTLFLLPCHFHVMRQPTPRQAS